VAAVLFRVFGKHYPAGSVSSDRRNLNALFGVAYDRSTLIPDPQLGNFWAT